MNELTQALEPYRRFDPTGWVALYRVIPLWAGLLMIALGLAMLWVGGGRLFRLVAAPIGAAVGVLWAPLVATRFGFSVQAHQISIAAAVLLAGLGLLFPPGALFFAFGIPAGLVAGEVAGTADWLLGFFPGFLVGGALAMAAHRSISAVASSIAGAWVLVLGLLASLASVGSLVTHVAAQPWGVIAAAGLFALAGTVYQLFVRLSPEERSRVADERRKAKAKLKEKRALEKRWETYSSSKGRDA